MVRELSGHEIDALHYELLIKDIIAAAEKAPPFPDVAWKIVSLVKSMAPIRENRWHSSPTTRRSRQRS